MEPIFEQLEKATRTLNATADRANELIRQTNERLQKLGVGISFWPKGDKEVVLHTDETAIDEWGEDGNPITLREWVLGYDKIGSWQLAVREDRYAGDPDHGYDFIESAVPYPLLSAERDLRIHAAEILPEFLRAYAAHVQEFASKLPKADE